MSLQLTLSGKSVRQDVARISKDLDGISRKKLPRIVPRTINTAIKRSRTALVNEYHDELPIQKKAIRNRLPIIQRASRRNWTGALRIKHSGTPLHWIIPAGQRRKTKGRGNRAKVEQGKGVRWDGKFYGGAFVLPNAKWVVRRTGKSKYPLRTVSEPLKNEFKKHLSSFFEKRATEWFRFELERQVRAIIAGDL